MTKEANNKSISRQDAVPIPKLLPISQKKSPSISKKNEEETHRQPNTKANK